MANRLPLLLLILLLVAAPALAQSGDGTQAGDTAPAEPAEIVGVVTGSVTNSTPGAVVPASGEPMLHIWDANFQEKGMEHGELAADGSFRFEDVPFVPSWQYAAMLHYQNVNYFSEPVSVSEQQSELSVELPVYEATTSTDNVQIMRQHILFDAAAADQVQVAEIFVLSNRGDRSVAPPADADPAEVPLAFTLPEGAENIGLDNNTNGRFKPTETGFVDTAPLRPGDGTSEVVVRYTLSYADALAYTYTAPWPVTGLNILLPARTGLTLEGESLEPLETRQMGDAGAVAIYQHQGLAAGESLTLNLSGALKAPPAPVQTQAEPTPAATGGNSVLAPVLLALGLFVVAVAVWLYRRPAIDSEPATAEATTFEALVTEIALLDEAHEAGRIDDTDYGRRRSLLFAQAQQLLPEG